MLEKSQVVAAPENAIPFTSQANSSENYAPLVLKDNYLYLYRYWYYEKKLSHLLGERIRKEQTFFPEKIVDILDQYFPTNAQEIDWQKIATMGVLLKRFCMISGSPGTGKTSTVVKLLAVLIEQSSSPPLIRLAAPTGKATQRLQESILENKQKLICPEFVKNLIPEEVSTIHRLFGYIPQTQSFRHDALNPLPADILVIDESSMIDLALMTQLVSALRPDARLILLGDHHQLTSVEAGWVFGSLCETKQERGYSQDFLIKLQKLSSAPLPISLQSEFSPGIQDSVMELHKNYRFKEESGIKILSQAVIEGKEEKAIEELTRARYPDIFWTSLPEAEATPPYYHLLRDRILEGFRDYLQFPDADLKNIFKTFSRFRILCGVLKSEMGVEEINLLVERVLKEAQLIFPERTWYRGRPVMITQNDYALQLFNGDIGITLTDSQFPEVLKVYFPEARGEYRSFLPQRLPKHETAFANTVHKSQGSEFERVLFLLPFHLSMILTRELVYTAITRAKMKVEIFGKESLLRQAIQRQENRVSGLKKRLLELETGTI